MTDNKTTLEALDKALIVLHTTRTYLANLDEFSKTPSDKHSPMLEIIDRYIKEINETRDEVKRGA